MSDATVHTENGGAEPLTRMELTISYVLRGGVLVSAGIILVGILWFALTQDTGYARVLPHHLSDLLAFHQTSGPSFFPTAFKAVFMGALAGKPYAIISLGMLLLIATPVVRVALSVFFFMTQRDWLYTGITLFVLVVLVLSLLSGLG
ncbi:MAG TPA: DUF1634 domain-containing protein [Candidatus Methylomirabilis sp.]|nr:DUF1634 domain-containing protein [Candidatus Methylomirabilis sp.]HSD50943.1 DUF1634 domain-containing protein [Candidatus Methylomirabilis sp.]